MKQWVARDGGGLDSLPTLGDPAAEQAFADLAEALHVTPTVVGLLTRRGFSGIREMNEFLAPNLRHLVPPLHWPGLEKAAGVLLEAIREGREVLIWGDYDVDGVTAAALCYEVLRYHNVPAMVHLPERQTEGYGLNAESIRALNADGRQRVLLTVDCGINDSEAVRAARGLGMTVVVTDHHVPPEVLPDADAVYDPRLTPDCPCQQLAGVGVAFFLMSRMNALLAPVSHVPPKDMREVLDLVCLGTLADMVGLSGQNRILAKNGLLKIAEAARPGVSDLKYVSGYDRAEHLGAGQVVFSLAPRLNAAGRIGSPMDAFHLLVGCRDRDSMSLARKLDDLNTARRAEEERIAKEAISQAEGLLVRQPDLAGLVVYGSGWHPGVIGIVASRLVEKYSRPTLVLCRLPGGTVLKGSGRSVPDFDLHAGLASCADVLAGFGGHRQAAGLSIEETRLDELRRRFHKAVMHSRGAEPSMPQLPVDGILPFALASDFTFLKTIELLQPFGVDNPEPLFVSRHLLVKSVKMFGPDREHATIRVQEAESGITLQAKLWRHAASLPPALVGRTVSLAFTLGVNTFNGITTVELTIKDWKIIK